MRVCPNCSRENPEDRDFCEECNTYLRWEPTVLTPSVPARPAGAPPSTSEPPSVPGRPAGHVAQRLPVIKEGQTLPTPAVHTKPLEAAAELVQITLRLPDDEGAGSAFAVTEVDPGGSAVVRALVRNQSGVVDNYELSIEGMPAEWWTIAPSTVYLVPFGAPGGQYEQEVEIRLHPPRSPEAEARAWTVQVVAESKAHGTRAGTATITATIAPYQEFETELRPEYARGRRRGNFAVAVRNRANAPSEFTFAAVDSGNACRFVFAEPVVTAAPGKRAGTTFRAKPRKQIWVGKPVDRRFQVTTTAPGSDGSVVSRPAVFRQKPWVAKWVPLVLPLVVAAVAAVILLLPHDTEVPNVRGRTVFAAKKLLESQGLALGEVTASDRKTQNRKLVGKIRDQSKHPGTKVKKGTAIAVQVWSGSGTVKVPDLKAMSLNEAKVALERAKLVVGKETPEPSDPDKAEIVSQSPPAQTLVKEGTPIDLFFPAIAEGTSTGAGTGTSTGEAGTSTPVKGAKGSLKVPALAGLLGAAAQSKLSAVGLDVQPSGAISTSKPGTIVDQSPASGTPVQPGTPIQVFVSVGFPKLAFDDGLDMKVMNGADGKHVRALAKTSDAEDEPSWQPGGTLLAYRRGSATDPHAGSIGILDTKNPVTSSRKLTEGPNDRRPVFAPNGKVLAFIRGAAGGTGTNQLCFLALKRSARVSCASAPNVDVDRPTWSADGTAILTVVTDPVDKSQSELFLFTTTKPFSAKGAAWSPQQILTDSMHGKRAGELVLFAAFSPDGKQVALAANWGSRDPTVFSVFLAPWTPTGLGKAKPVNPTMRACDVAWRSDSKELAVTQMDDCGGRTGDIVRFDPANPSSQTTLLPNAGSNPAWQPIDLATH